MIFLNKKYLFSNVLLCAAVYVCAAAQISDKTNRQTAEQLLNYLRSNKSSAAQSGELTASPQNNKCGFGIRASIHDRWNNFTSLEKIEVANLLQIGSFEKDTVIGRFHIYYNISNDSTNTPALLDAGNSRIPNTAKQFVDSVGRIFNEVYHVEVEQLGYDPPPFETGESSYRILIMDLSDYGLTEWDPNLQPLNPGSPAPRYPCYIQIHKDFRPFVTKGMQALQVTAAHEFHHVIQVGSYGYRSNDHYAYELTSTWIEDLLYTDVNDYWNYLPLYFRGFSDGQGFSDGLSFNVTTNIYLGYERCIWDHYLAKRFGSDIILEIWKAIPSMTFLESNNAALLGRGSNLRIAFAEFSYWNYFTADRANTEMYYPEGTHYPRYKPLQHTTFYNTTATLRGDVGPLSSSMYEFDMNGDAITAIISNVDIDAAENFDLTGQTVKVTLASGSISQPYQELSNGLKVNVAVDMPKLWLYSFSENAKRTDASPNPLRLSETPQLLLPINEDPANYADVYFYNSSLDLVYSGRSNVMYEFGTRVVVVKTSSVRSKLSSGIHFVIAKTPTKDYQWKIAVIK
jgi:hypothetical protein